MQIYNLTVTNGNAKVDYGYYSLVALNAKLNAILSEDGSVSGYNRIITITVATVQL